MGPCRQRRPHYRAVAFRGGPQRRAPGKLALEGEVPLKGVRILECRIDTVVEGLRADGSQLGERRGSIREGEQGIQYLLPLLMEFELSDANFRELADYCSQRQITFLCTAWDRASVDLLESMDVAGYKIGSPDMTNFPLIEYVGATGKGLPHKALRRLQDNDADYKRWLWYRFGCGFSTTDEGYPYGPCGLCAIHRLRQAGVASIKIAGREGATARKIKSVEMVHQVLQTARLGGDAKRVATTAVGIRKTLAHCKSGYMCYYPEVRLE